MLSKIATIPALIKQHLRSKNIHDMSLVGLTKLPDSCIHFLIKPCNVLYKLSGYRSLLYKKQVVHFMCVYANCIDMYLYMYMIIALQPTQCYCGQFQCQLFGYACTCCLILTFVNCHISDFHNSQTCHMSVVQFSYTVKLVLLIVFRLRCKYFCLTVYCT